MERRQVVSKDPVKITTQFCNDSQYSNDNFNQEIKARHALKRMIQSEISGNDCNLKSKHNKVVIIKVLPKSQGYLYMQSFGIHENPSSPSSSNSCQYHSDGGNPFKEESSNST